MRRLQSILILLVLGLVLNACASLPASPQGQTCIGDVAKNGVDCVPISSAIKRGFVSHRDQTSFVPFSGIDNWVCFDPTTWANIQTYIGQLKVLAQQNCSGQ